MQTHAGNGGFPEPPLGEPQRLVRVRHADCGAETRVRLPTAVPADAIRRVVCDRCASPYECDGGEEIGFVDSREAADRIDVARLPGERSHRAAVGSHARRIAGSLIAGAFVVASLIAIQDRGSGGATSTATPARSGGAVAAQPGSGTTAVGGDARFLAQPGFSLALPPAWERSAPPSGAAFAARSVDGTAQATLWIHREPGLTFARFVHRSLIQLRSLAGSARIAGRTPAPTVAGTIVSLRADAPAGGGASTYDVTLRQAGPYHYYLSTLVQPGASAAATQGADLIHGSFVPEPGGSTP